MSVQKKSLISSRAVSAKAESSEKSTSIGESKPLQANAPTIRIRKAGPAAFHSLKKKK
jgi:hypothetical protein